MPLNELKSVLDTVNGWLRFAESKNGVLLALNISAAAAGRNLAADLDSTVITIFRYAFVILMFASAAVCLRSFFPRLKESILLGRCAGKLDRINPLYFGAIARLTAENYEDLIRSMLYEDKALSQWDRAYVEQIKTNSTIANAKYLCFMVASALTGLGLLMLAVLSIASM